MKCMNCEANIPPEWKGCIQANICPGCSKQIYSNQTGQLILEIKEALAFMPNDPEGLAGWLVSNYNMTKVGDGEPTIFHTAKEKTQPIQAISNGKRPKPISRSGESDIESEPINIKTKNAKLASIVKQAKESSNSSSLIFNSMDEIPDEDAIPLEEEDPSLPEDPAMRRMVDKLARR